MAGDMVGLTVPHAPDCLGRDGLPCSCGTDQLQATIVRAIGTQMRQLGEQLMAPEVKAWRFDIDDQLPRGDTVGWPRPVLFTLAASKEDAIRYLAEEWERRVQSDSESWPSHMSPNWSKVHEISEQVWVENLE